MKKSLTLLELIIGSVTVAVFLLATSSLLLYFEREGAKIQTPVSKVALTLETGAQDIFRVVTSSATSVVYIQDKGHTLLWRNKEGSMEAIRFLPQKKEIRFYSKYDLNKGPLGKGKLMLAGVSQAEFKFSPNGMVLMEIGKEYKVLGKEKTIAMRTGIRPLLYAKKDSIPVDSPDNSSPSGGGNRHYHGGGRRPGEGGSDVLPEGTQAGENAIEYEDLFGGSTYEWSNTSPAIEAKILEVRKARLGQVAKVKALSIAIHTGTGFNKAGGETIYIWAPSYFDLKKHIGDIALFNGDIVGSQDKLLMRVNTSYGGGIVFGRKKIALAKARIEEGKEAWYSHESAYLKGCFAMAKRVGVDLNNWRNAWRWMNYYYAEYIPLLQNGARLANTRRIK